MPTIPGDLRVVARSAALLALTPAVLGLLEAERALRRAPAADVIHGWTRRWGRMAARLYGLTVLEAGPFLGEGRVYPGRDGAGRGRVFVMNHRAMMDVFVALGAVTADFVARADIEGWPVVGLAARRVHTLFVDRGSRASGLAVVRSMAAALASGRPVMVFPEGTTFEGDAVRPFRSGAFRAAIAAGAEVVPLGLAYADPGDEYGDETFSAHYRRVAARPRTRAAVVAGDPMPTTGLDPGPLRERVHERVQHLVGEARRLLAEAPR